MHCPKCNKALIADKHSIRTCPSQHGMLIGSSILSDIKTGEIAHNESSNSSISASHLPKKCPKCSNIMSFVDYNFTGIIIDSCTNCHLRWLDQGELLKIKKFKPKFKPEDILFIEKFEQKLKKSKETVINEDINPSVPTSELPDRIGSPSALGGTALVFIVRGLFHSKATRIIILSMLVIFGIGFYLVFISFPK